MALVSDMLKADTARQARRGMRRIGRGVAKTCKNLQKAAKKILVRFGAVWCGLPRFGADWRRIVRAPPMLTLFLTSLDLTQVGRVRPKTSSPSHCRNTVLDATSVTSQCLQGVWRS